MSSFEPNKRHLPEALIYFFNLKKTAADAHQIERGVRAWFEKVSEW